jgi:hypothetical protein
MRWQPFVPGKATLVLLYRAAQQRMAEQTNDIADLPDWRIISATEELNQIADDVRDAMDVLDHSHFPISALDTRNPPRQKTSAATGK